MSVNSEEETSAVLDRVGNQVIDRTKTELYGGIQCDCQEEKDALMGQKTLNVVWPIKNTQRGGNHWKVGLAAFHVLGSPTSPLR